jgi:hypothetical protein
MDKVPQLKKSEANLETHRFGISPESMLMMKETREMFKGLQEKYPELVAMSFFGSRIRGKEHGASTKVITHPELGSSIINTLESDLDLIIFYNEELAPLTGPQARDPRNIGKIFADITEFSHELKEKKGIVNQLNPNGIDASEYYEEKDLSNFKKQASLTLGDSLGDFYLGGDSPFNLTARFLLSIGDIYPLREIVFRDFESDLKGEFYWKELMILLSEFERPWRDHKDDKLKNLPKYYYPQTLAEGREYFLKLRKKEVRQ